MRNRKMLYDYLLYFKIIFFENPVRDFRSIDEP